MAEKVLEAGTTDEMARLRSVLTEAGYTDHAVVAHFGSAPLPTRRNRGIPRFLKITSAGTRLDVLARLFLMSVPVPEASARAALEAGPLETLLAAGVLERRADGVAGVVTLVPFGHLWLAIDQPEKVNSGQGPDLVMGLSSSTTDLMRFTIRRRVASAFDFGTGCGIQGFMAAPHSGEVLAVDRSARAVSFARFNAALNGIANFQAVEGDRFAPAAGRRFGLIVGNLPFVVNPSRRYLYRDNDLPLDGFARQAVRAAPQYLEEGGFCQFICEWVHPAGEDWRRRLAGWVADTGCDVHVFRQVSANPLSYAESWIRDTERDDPETFARLFEEWTAYYERERIEGISTGFIAMRRRGGGSNWLHFDDIPAEVPEDYGEHLLRLFAVRDFLESLRSDDVLLQEPLAVAPDARLATECTWAPGGWRISRAELRHERGDQSAGNLDQRSIELLARMDGRRPLRAVLTDMAASLNVPAEKVIQAALAPVRSLIEGGFLLPREAALLTSGNQTSPAAPRSAPAPPTPIR